MRQFALFAFALTFSISPAGEAAVRSPTGHASAPRASNHAWYPTTIHHSALDQPGFYGEVQELFRHRVQLSQTPSAPPWESAASAPATLTPEQAADGLVYLFLKEPESLEAMLPSLAKLDPELVGAIASSAFILKPVQAAKKGFKIPKLTWFGRTAAVDLGDGSMLAAKISKSSEWTGLLEHEAQDMAAVREFLPSAGEPVKGRNKAYEQVTKNNPSWILYRADKDYFTYLNDALPKSMNAVERAESVQDSAMRSMDQIIELQRRNVLHSSLAAFSHGGSSWKWNFFRWEGLRFGPTAIHNWTEGFRYPNLRKSGLADWGHLRKEKLKPEQKAAIMGQNLFEWSLLVLHSAQINKLSSEIAVQLVIDGFEKFTDAYQVSDRAALLQKRVRNAVSATANRFSLYRFVPHSKMPGLVVHPIIADAVWPLMNLVAPRPPDVITEPKGVDFEIFALTFSGTAAVGGTAGLVGVIWLNAYFGTTPLVEWLILAGSLLAASTYHLLRLFSYFFGRSKRLYNDLNSRGLLPESLGTPLRKQL